MKDEEPRPQRSPLGAGLICTAMFFSGAALLELELLAAGWLAPLFGGGIDVWAAVLGVTLGAMVLGYFAGSLTAPRWSGPPALAWLFSGAGISLLACTWLLRGTVKPGPELMSAGWLLGAAALLLGLPVVLLAAASPWAVEAVAVRTGACAGRASGAVYAVSTLGGVAGALATGLWLVPALGLWYGALICALLLAAAALAATLAAQRRAWLGLLAVVLLVLTTIGAYLLRNTKAEASSVGGRRLSFREDTWYGRNEVFEDDHALYLFVNGVPQTRAPRFGVIPPSKALTRSGGALELLPFVRPTARRALVIGLGGGLISRYLASYGLEVDSVEIDPGVVRIARRHFGFKGGCHVEDGRRFLNRTSRRYDVVVLDVYRGEDLPAHLCTREFFQLVCGRLAPGGLLAVNLIGAVGTDDAGAVLRTLGTAFPEVALFSPGGGEALGPMTLMASPDPILEKSTVDRLAARGLKVPTRVDLGNFNPERYPLLTDEHNPIAILRRPTARAWRAAALRLLNRNAGASE